MNEELLFAAALDKPLSERKSFLEEACGDNSELRAEVARLLEVHERQDSFFEHPPLGADRTVEVTDGGGDTEKAANWSGSLSFLGPCDKPGRIGKLGGYEIVEVVGHGGMGVVLRAFDTKLSRIVAVKVLAPELAANPTAVKRFLREASTAAAVVHDHVVTIHAVEDDFRPPYLVMEFVQGQTLQQKLERQGALELKHILRIGSQAAAGLAAAHKQGLIHRDVKPGNILLENGVERVKITDFGLARSVDDLNMTQTGLIAGTPQYMSPEQAQGEPIDCRSDLFSLGSVLYAMCTGRPPFRAESTVGILRRVCDDTPRSIREINPEIPSWLEAIVAKLLAKNPNDRFQSAAEISELLRQHLAHVQNPGIVPRPQTIELPPVAAVRSSGNSGLSTALTVIAIAVTLLLAVPIGLGALAVLAYWLMPIGAEMTPIEESIARNANATAPVEVVLGPVVAELPADTRRVRGWGASWSPDSQRLIRQPAEIRPATNNALEIFDLATGKDSGPLAIGKDPCWSPVASGPIAYVQQLDRAASIWIMNADGGNVRRISDGFYVCGWSPDGTRVYDIDTTGLQVRSIDWSQSDPKPETLIQLPFSTAYPSVSPDGRLLACRRIESAQTSLVVMEIATKRILAETQLPGWKGVLCGWSPDSKSVAYGEFGFGDDVGLWLLDVSTAASRKLLEGKLTLPRWSPDGKWIAADDRMRGEVVIFSAEIVAGALASAVAPF